MKYLILFATFFVGYSNLSAFCGFYVAKADAKLFNESSQVIMVRDGNHTVITMSNDFQGAVADFAMVVPVPVVLEESDIRVVQQAIFDKFDAYTAPRMVEYFDENPCSPRIYESLRSSKGMVKEMSTSASEELTDDFDKDMGVTVEATYTVGEYDILILSAKESGGLKTWLTTKGYKIPADADEVLDPYINDGMKFFVVKVNLEEQKKAGYANLRPLQIQFNADRFMLPIRLGMANAKTTQDLIVYAFTRNGRVETANYRTTKLPTDREIPLVIKEQDKFGEFYKAVYDKAWKNEGKNSVMLEYAWNITGKNPVKCDPCNSPLVTFAELREAGVWWLQGNQFGGYTGDLFVSRLHVRYGRKNFPQDLMFLNTPNAENFQGRYIVRHPATGDLNCAAGKKYKAELKMRKKREVQELVALTGWSASNYYGYMGYEPEAKTKVKPEEVKAPEESIANVKTKPISSDSTTVAWSPGTTPAVAQKVIEEPEAAKETSSDEFLERAQQQASTPANNQIWLLALAAGMFVLGLAVRGFTKKKA